MRVEKKIMTVALALGFALSVGGCNDEDKSASSGEKTTASEAMKKAGEAVGEKVDEAAAAMKTAAEKAGEKIDQAADAAKEAAKSAAEKVTAAKDAAATAVKDAVDRAKDKAEEMKGEAEADASSADAEKSAEETKTAEVTPPAAEAAKPAEEAAPTEAETPAAEEAKPAEEAKSAEAEAPASEEAKPADGEAAASGSEPDNNPEDPDNAAVRAQAKELGLKWEDGRYRDKDGHPAPVVTKDYKVDWAVWQGFRRYHDACHVCHGPNGLGSSFAPGLADSLKTMDYESFYGTVVGGRVTDRAGTKYVMPAFGEDKNIMCYLDDIYSYLKARSTGAMPPGRPNGRQDISDEARKAGTECFGEDQTGGGK